MALHCDASHSEFRDTPVFTTGDQVAIQSMPILVRTRIALFLAAAALAALTACGETTVNAPLAAGSVAATNAITLTGPVGSTLPDPVRVTVRSTDNQPLAGATVTFSVTSGGVADPSSAVTDANGVAFTKWTLGRTAGSNVLTATSGGVSATFTAVAGASKAAAVAGVTGDNQSAVAGTAVATAPSVKVTDAFNNPVEGVAVTFTVLSGGGRVTSGVARTNAAGAASVGSWILGNSTGVQTLAARVEDGGVTANPIIFTASATAGGPATASAASATSQTAPVGAFVTTLPSVRVNDVNGNPVAAVPVAFAITSGGGTVTGGSQLTNAQGVATVGSWLLGTTAGANTVTAVAIGAGSVVFTASGSAVAASQLVASAGTNQRAQVSKAVAIAPTVIARDIFNNPVAGVVVTFTIGTGGGTVVSGRQVSDATGTATVGAWFLGDSPGANSLVASAPGLTSVTFTATGDPGRPVSLVANSSIAQSAAAGAIVGDSPSVVVRDQVGNPVSGVVVTFTVSAGGGTVTGSPATTNSAGVATLTSWTLGTTVGTNTVTATATGLTSVAFNATGTAGAAATVVIVAGQNQVGLQGTNVVTRPSVRVADVNGNAVAGATVTFAVINGSGSATGLTQTTDASGSATVGSWTLGIGSQNQLTAAVSGLNITGNPVTFTAQSATQIRLVSNTPGPIAPGGTVNVSVQLADAAGAAVPIAGISMTIAITTGGTAGTLNGTGNSFYSLSTDANGAITFPTVVTGAAGTRGFTITGSGLASAVTAIITFN